MATLDVISGGRVIAGFGLGHAPPKGPTKALHNLGIDGHKRGKMSDEALEFVTRLWTADELVSFEGEFYRGIDLAVSPKPVQKPYPELWWAGYADPSIRRAAQFGAMLEASQPSLSKVREVYAPKLAEANHQYGGNATLGGMFHAWVGDELSPTQLQSRYFGWEGDALDAMAAGSPEQCAQTIRDFAQAGMKHFVLDFHRHGLDPVDTIHDQMERWANEVVPRLD